MVDFDEASTPITHLEAIRMLLGVSCSRIFTYCHMDVKSAFLNRYLNEDLYQDMPKNLYDMLVTEFPTQRKDEQAAKLDEQHVVLNVLPFHMIVLINVPKPRSRDTEIKKDKTPKEKYVDSMLKKMSRTLCPP